MEGDGRGWEVGAKVGAKVAEKVAEKGSQLVPSCENLR